MKIIIIRVTIVVLLLGTFFLIFGFSHQNGEESGNLSSKIAKLVIQPNTEQDRKYDEQVLKKAEKIIRKLAHFSIYACVGFLFMCLLSTYKIKISKSMIICLSIGVLYAISDEIHQGFIPGRTPQITDVMIDTMGVVLGMLCVLILFKIHKKYKHNVAKKVTLDYTSK